MLSQDYRILRAMDDKDRVYLAAGDDGSRYVLKRLSADSISMYERISELDVHEHLETVRELIGYEGSTVAVCEYIDGSTLSELMNGGRSFPLADIKKMMCELCSAVEHLHKNNIIHRDINPSNIIIDSDLKLKLADYSIARLFSGGRDQDTTIFGTEGYSAPEQYGFMETRYTADIYSLGIVLRTLLNCCSDGSVSQEVRLRRIAAKCSAFDPDKRYSCVADVRRAVERVGSCIPVFITIAGVGCAALFTAGVILLSQGQKNGGQADTASETQEAAAAITTIMTTTADTTEVTTDATAASTAATTTAKVTTTTQVISAATTTAETYPVTTTTTETPATTTTGVTSTTADVLPWEQEWLDIFTIVGSDTVNPDKITYTKHQNDEGIYYDSCDYVFYDDPAVHGDWEYCCNMLLGNNMIPATAEGILNARDNQGAVYKAISIHEGGTAYIYYNSPDDAENTREPIQTLWTNGYLIDNIYLMDDTRPLMVVQRMFAAVYDDVDFLFVEFKTGDYVFKDQVNSYFIFTRKQQ